MRLHIRLFAGMREVVGHAHLDLEIAEAATVDEIVDSLIAAHPRLGPYRAHAKYALDGSFVPATTRIARPAELAIMPPVSGGAIQEEPFSLDAMIEALSRAGAGAVVGFVGYVRADHGTTRLRFEAYAEMAEREIAAIRDEAIKRFELTDLAIRHRVTTLAVGEPIVAVAAAAPHRREAFEAAAWVMDELKTRVPIWKAEERPEGARWVNDPTE